MGGGARGGKAHPKFLESSILTFIVILSYYQTVISVYTSTSTCPCTHPSY